VLAKVPPRVQYEKIARGCVGERLIHHEAKSSAVLGSRPTPECYFFHIAQAWRCFNWFKATNSSFWLRLAVRKFYAHDQQCCIFPTQYCIFLYGKNGTVICLMFTYANALRDFTGVMWTHCTVVCYNAHSCTTALIS